MDYDTVPQESLNTPSEQPEKKHYYASAVRILFAISAIIMLVSSPFFIGAKLLGAIFVLFGIILIVLAGITNRGLKGIFFINVITSLFIIVVLELISFNIVFSEHPFLMILTQIIALLLLAALYYSLRTLRGFLFK